MRGITFLELVVTMGLILVLATLGISHYAGVRERALDDETRTTLTVLVAAERDFRRSQGNFLCTNSEADLNANLIGVVLPTVNMRWDYSISCRNAPITVCAQGVRVLGSAGRSWRLCSSENAPVSGTCGGNAANCP